MFRCIRVARICYYSPYPRSCQHAQFIKGYYSPPEVSRSLNAAKQRLFKGPVKCYRHHHVPSAIQACPPSSIITCIVYNYNVYIVNRSTHSKCHGRNKGCKLMGLRSMSESIGQCLG
jgi:hypothetical protein